MNKTEIEQLSEDMKNVKLLIDDIENLLEETYPIKNRTATNNRVIITVLMMLAVNTVKHDYNVNALTAYDLLLSTMMFTKDQIVALFDAGISDTKH